MTLITQAIKQHESSDQAIRLIFSSSSPSFALVRWNQRASCSLPHLPRKRNAIIKMGRGWLTQSHSRLPPRSTYVQESQKDPHYFFPPFGENARTLLVPSLIRRDYVILEKFPGKIKEWKNHKIEIAPPLLRRLSTGIVAESNRWDKIETRKSERLFQKWQKFFASLQ